MEDNIEAIVKESKSNSDVCRALGLPINGKNSKKVKELIQGCDTSHFGRRNVKYPPILKICPVCGKEFSAKLGHPKEKQTCSYSCSNTHFRSGENNGMYGNTIEGTSGHYRRICFDNHKKECILSCCSENNIVEVHHYDENKENNSPDNLIPLCPTHHRYWHSGFKYLIEDEVKQYVKNLKNNMSLSSTVG